MLILFLRTILLYIFVLTIMRLMGKREIGQLQPFELAIILIISDLASIPMQNIGAPILDGLIPIFTITILQVFLSFLTIKSEKFSQFISGTPTILVENGKLLEKNMRDQKYSISELLEQLRMKDVVNISDVEYAILETNGQVSVVSKSQKRPVTPEDLKIDTKYEGIPTDLVFDGRVLTSNLKKINLDRKWLEEELKKFGLTIEETFYANINKTGDLYYQRKDEAV